MHTWAVGGVKHKGHHLDGLARAAVAIAGAVVVRGGRQLRVGAIVLGNKSVRIIQNGLCVTPLQEKKTVTGNHHHDCDDMKDNSKECTYNAGDVDIVVGAVARQIGGFGHPGKRTVRATDRQILIRTKKHQRRTATQMMKPRNLNVT